MTTFNLLEPYPNKEDARYLINEELFKDVQIVFSGSKDLDKEYAELAPTEAKNRLAVLIDKMDRDANGFISKKELTDWVLNSFR